MKRLLVILIWLPTTLVTLFVALSLQNYSHYYSVKQNFFDFNDWFGLPPSGNYQLYTSLPKVLGATTFSVKAEDAVPALVEEYLIQHNSPMAPYADSFILAARKNGIDPLLMLAIAQCESNLGKKMPPGCNNPFGWGIHSQGTLCFANWHEGFETVANGLREKYFNEGMDSPEELMVRYTPPALEKEGSWAKCVQFFLAQYRLGQ